LNLLGASIKDDSAAVIAKFPNLEGLDLSLAIGGNEISDVGLNLLRQIPTLAALDVSGSQRTDSGLGSASMTDSSLDVIGSLTRLERLNVPRTKIRDAGMGKLAHLLNLESLNAAETQLSARAHVVLEKFPRLRELNLWNAPRITDVVVPLINALPHLQWVDLTGAKMTAAASEKIHARLP
jgi:hypothetical protein